MDDVNSSMNGSGGEGTGGASTLESNSSDSGTQNSDPINDSQGGGQDSTTNEGNAVDDGFITGDDGKQYIPKEAFDARIAKLSAQKNEAREILETIKNDPTVRKEFLESLNVGDLSGKSSEDSEEPTPFEQFLAPLPQEHQAHYRNMAQSMASEFTSFVQKHVKEQLGPIMRWMGEEKVNRFSQTNKDFGKYQQTVAKIMESGRATNVEDAYRLASFDDKIKGVFNAGQREEVERRNKIQRTPSAGQNSGGANTRNNKPMSLRESLNKAGAEFGYTG